MAAFSTKGMTVWLQKKPGSNPTATPVSNVTNSKPAVVTVASSAITGFHDGDVVQVAGTGMAALDGKTFIIADVDDQAYTFALVGSDASSAPAAATTGTVTNITADLIEFCLATVDYQLSPAQAISVGTTCDPSAQLAGEPQAGTLSITGFVDLQSAGYLEFLNAVNDQQPRVLVIRYPDTASASGQSGIIFPSVTATGYSITHAVNAAVAFTGEFTLGTRPTFVTG